MLRCEPQIKKLIVWCCVLSAIAEILYFFLKKMLSLEKGEQVAVS